MNLTEPRIVVSKKRVPADHKVGPFRYVIDRLASSVEEDRIVHVKYKGTAQQPLSGVQGGDQFTLQ
jgi:hypothetical protein